MIVITTTAVPAPVLGELFQRHAYSRIIKRKITNIDVRVRKGMVYDNRMRRVRPEELIDIDNAIIYGSQVEMFELVLLAFGQYGPSFVPLSNSVKEHMKYSPIGISFAFSEGPQRSPRLSKLYWDHCSWRADHIPDYVI